MLRLQLLDSFELTHGDRRLDLPLPAQRLLAFLALHDQPMLRGYVAGALWLARQLTRLRQHIRPIYVRLGIIAE